MSNKLHKRSEIERKLAEGEAVKEPPRQIIRELSSGRILSNECARDMLPPFLIAMQSNTLIYNDIDVEALRKDVSEQASRIHSLLRDNRFEDAGILYQQFIDNYDACFERPFPDSLDHVKRRGIDLYAVLEHCGAGLTEDMSRVCGPGEEVECRFNAVTEAHINLFFYMLTLELAIHNKVDASNNQLRKKLSLLENRLKKLLEKYIYGDGNGVISPYDISEGKTLYSWILLEHNDLDTAQKIYESDRNLIERMSFSELYTEVMGIYRRYDNDYTPYNIRRNFFGHYGLSDIRVEIALKLSYYLEQTARISQFINELTQNSDSQDPNKATVDVQSLLLNLKPE